MSKLIIPKLATTERLSIIPAESQLLFDNEEKILYVGDGVTPGGIPVGSGVSGGSGNLDGGVPSSVYTIESIDGGGI